MEGMQALMLMAEGLLLQPCRVDWRCKRVEIAIGLLSWGLGDGSVTSAKRCLKIKIDYRKGRWSTVFGEPAEYLEASSQRQESA